jgi:hypothetical protein
MVFMDKTLISIEKKFTSSFELSEGFVLRYINKNSISTYLYAQDLNKSGTYSNDINKQQGFFNTNKQKFLEFFGVQKECEMKFNIVSSSTFLWPSQKHGKTIPVLIFTKN